MLSELSFFVADYDSIISVSRSKISLVDPNGNRQDYFGKFYSDYYGDLDWDSSSLSGFTQYNGRVAYWKAEQLSMPGSIYYNFSEEDDGYGFLEYALRANDTITGSNFEDSLYGGAGNDNLNGRSGNDYLWGGPGTDLLTGGRGADTFYFSSENYTGSSMLAASTIKDFKPSEGDIVEIDLVDESGLAVPVVYVNSFSGIAGEYRASAIRKGFLLSLDSSGDGIADAFLRITGIKSFDSSYVIDSNQFIA